MSYQPLQELFDLQTGIKTAVEQGKQIVPMWDDTNSKSFYRVSYWNATTNTMATQDVSADMSGIYTAGASVVPLESTLRGILNLLLSGITTTQTGTSNVNVTNAISVAASALPTGAATASGQTSGNSSLSSIDNKVPTLGQKLMAASLPVVISTDQSALPLSTNAATAAAQASILTALNAGISTSDFANALISSNNIAVLNGLAIAVQDIATVKYKKIQFALTGTFVLTLTAQASNDGSNYFAVPIKNITAGTLANTVTTTGLYSVDVSMFKNFRLICTAYVSGTVNAISYGVYDSTDVSVPTVTTQAVSGTVAVSGNPAVVLTPLATAGASPLGAFVSAASGTQTVAAIKGSGGVLYGCMYAVTQGASATQGEVYLRFYNQVALPTPGTTVPVHVLRLTSDGDGYISFGDMGIRFATGITIAITGAIANTATNTAVASSVSFFGI